MTASKKWDVKEWYGSIKAWIKKISLKQDGGKTRLSREAFYLLICVPLTIWFIWKVFHLVENDTSYIRKSAMLDKKEASANASSANQNSSAGKGSAKNGIAGLLSDGSSGAGNQSQTINRRGGHGSGQREKINYRAKQVLSRDDVSSGDTLPSGTNMIGQLLTSIDTRDNSQMVKVILPYGGFFHQNPILEKETVLLGTINYPGSGDKVLVHFSSGILPSGKEFKIDAVALDTKDFSSGIPGQVNSEADVRIASTLGLTMVSGAAEALTEKESLSDRQAPVAKATLKNAFYNGVAKTSEVEAEREAADLSTKKDYLTVDAGADVVVSLAAPLKKETLQ